MLVKVLDSVSVAGEVTEAGSNLDLPDPVAERLIRLGKVEPIKQPRKAKS